MLLRKLPRGQYLGQMRGVLVGKGPADGPEEGASWAQFFIRGRHWHGQCNCMHVCAHACTRVRALQVVVAGHTFERPAALSCELGACGCRGNMQPQYLYMTAAPKPNLPSTPSGNLSQKPTPALPAATLLVIVLLGLARRKVAGVVVSEPGRAYDSRVSIPRLPLRVWPLSEPSWRHSGHSLAVGLVWVKHGNDGGQHWTS